VMLSLEKFVSWKFNERSQAESDVDKLESRCRIM